GNGFLCHFLLHGFPPSFLLLYARQGGTYSLWIRYFISSPSHFWTKSPKVFQTQKGQLQTAIYGL
ncbi:hypothetical protein, partial [Thomasclavelia cocleata]|uniref:hypothetical protein n=1 Tax=Thomasclavelia cocleata TaxID=69824 RepID=UPI002577B04E